MDGTGTRNILNKNGLFQLDDEPNLYLKKRLEITKHPLKTGCLGFQVYIYICNKLDTLYNCLKYAYCVEYAVDIYGKFVDSLEAYQSTWVCENFDA